MQKDYSGYPVEYCLMNRATFERQALAPRRGVCRAWIWFRAFVLGACGGVGQEMRLSLHLRY